MGARHFKELVSFRLYMLASTWSRLVEESNEKDFALDPREWRILGMLGAYAPMSLQGLAREVNDLLKRDSDISAGRGVQLSLTLKGRELYRKLFSKAVRRNEDLLAVLTPEARAVLERALDVLIGHAQDTLVKSRQGMDGRKKTG